jgi:hypothetical protein
MINAKYYTFPHLFGFIKGNIFYSNLLLRDQEGSKAQSQTRGKEVSEIWAQS